MPSRESRVSQLLFMLFLLLCATMLVVNMALLVVFPDNIWMMRSLVFLPAAAFAVLGVRDKYRK
jgi:hypothetical protein